MLTSWRQVFNSRLWGASCFSRKLCITLLWIGSRKQSSQALSFIISGNTSVHTCAKTGGHSSVFYRLYTLAPLPVDTNQDLGFHVTWQWQLWLEQETGRAALSLEADPCPGYTALFLRIVLTFNCDGLAALWISLVWSHQISARTMFCVLRDRLWLTL